MKDGQLQIDLENANQVRTLFKPSSWLTKIDFINHLVLFNNVLITVLAEKGAGKTSFSSLLLNSLDQQIKPVFMTIEPPCDKAAIIGDIAAQLHLNTDADTQVASLVTQINERKAHILLIIDDAQNVSEELIKEFMLAIRSQHDLGFFHLCLVSDYSLVATLNNLAANQFSDLIHSLELDSLTESETRTYVLQRAMTSRLINKPLTDAQFKQFYHLTKGSISKINAQLESFIFKCSNQKQSSKVINLIKGAGIAACAAILGGLSFLYLNDLSSPIPVKASPLIEPVAVSDIPSIEKAMKESFLVAQEEQLPSYVPNLHDSSYIELAQHELPKEQILSGEDTKLCSSTALVNDVVVIPAISSQLAANEAIAQLNKAQVIKQPLEQAQIHSAKAKPKQAVVARVARSSGFTIQLLASHNKGDIHRLKRSNKFYAQAKIKYFSNQKGSWYVLTLGSFNNRAQAQAQINKLPAFIAKSKPWVRALNGLSDKG